MSQPPYNKRQIDGLIKQATALAKKGNYDKASYLLHPIRSDKRAQRLLEQMSGRSNKVKLTDFFNTTVLTMLGFGIIVIAVVIFMFNGIVGEVSERDAVYAEFPARGLVGNNEFYFDLVSFCRENLETGNGTCFDWSETVFTNHETDVRSCIVINDQGFAITDDNRDAITTCFLNAGIPSPTP